MGALLLALAPLWRATAIRELQVMPAERQKRELTVESVRYRRTVVPWRGLVLADYQSSLLLCYYYDPRKFCINEGSAISGTTTLAGSFESLWLKQCRMLMSRRPEVYFSNAGKPECRPRFLNQLKVGDHEIH